MKHSCFAVAASLSLAACSNHPIVDDVTPYSTSDVVNKVRCEILTQLLRYVDAGRLEALRREFETYDAARNIVKYATKPVLELKKTVDRIDAEFKDINKKRASLPKRKAKLIEDRNKLDDKIGQLIKVVTATADNVRETDDRVGLLRLQGRLINLQADASKLATESERIATRQKDLDAETTIHDEREAALDAELRGALNGAKDVLPAYNEHKDAAERLKKAEKDLDQFGSAFSKYYAFATTNVALQFRFQITENNNGTAGGSIVWPVALGTLTLGFESIGKKKKRLSERTVQVSEDFSDLLRIRRQCMSLDFGTELQSPRARIYPVTGNIGIGELVDQFLQLDHAVKLAKVAKDSKDKHTFYEKLQFTTTLKGGLKPSLVLSPSKGHTVKFDGDFNADREDLHEVIVDIFPGTEPADAAPGGREPKDGETKINLVKVPDLSIRLVKESEWQTSTTPTPDSRGNGKQ